MAASILVSSVLSAALLVGGGYVEIQAAQPAEVPVVLTTINLNLVHQQISGPESAMNVAIRSDEEWRAFWSTIEPRTSREIGQRTSNPPPLIDFARHILLVAALGTKPVAVDSVSINAATDVGDNVIVDVLHTVTAGANCTHVTWITYPVAFAMIPATTKPVFFRNHEKTIGCGRQ